MTNNWRVFTVEQTDNGLEVISTLWTEQGATDDRRVMLRTDDRAEADGEAKRLQATYDELRQTPV